MLCTHTHTLHNHSCSLKLEANMGALILVFVLLWVNNSLNFKDYENSLVVLHIIVVVINTSGCTGLMCFVIGESNCKYS